MGKYDDILLVSDLDGTIVPHNGQISPENRAAIKELVRGGGAFAVATGRTPASALDYLADIELTAPSVFYNGAMLKDIGMDKVIKALALEENVWRQFARTVLKELPTACVEVYTEEGCHVVSPQANDDPRLKTEYRDYKHVDIASLDKETWLKFFVMDEPFQLKILEQLAAAEGVAELANAFYSEVNYYEFVSIDASKGAMVAELKQLPELIGRRVIACGDYQNDIAMLKLADVGVAPANAEQLTKDSADVVGVHCEEHLLAWILKEIL